MQTVREIWGRKSIYGKLPIAQIEFPVDDKWRSKGQDRSRIIVIITVRWTLTMPGAFLRTFCRLPLSIHAIILGGG